MPVIIEFSRCISTYSSAKFELEKLKFSSAFGFSNTRDLQKNYLSTFEKEGDALDVVIKILKIPGVLQRNYPGTTHDRVNECIGKIFNLKMEKLIV